MKSLFLPLTVSQNRQIPSPKPIDISAVLLLLPFADIFCGCCREYGQVWQFLKEFDLPYCSLYDKGYTSLGKTTDTHPNPYLRRNAVYGEEEEEHAYWPAYMLADWTKERAGRSL